MREGRKSLPRTFKGKYGVNPFPNPKHISKVFNRPVKFFSSIQRGGPIAGGSAITISREKHDDRIVLLDTLSGTTVTLPQATGTGARYKFIVSATPTSNAHVIQVANATDVLVGKANMLDNDSNAATAYAATSTDDTLTMSGTTTGGVIGATVEIVDIATGYFSVQAELVVPAGSNVADPFSAAVS